MKIQFICFSLIIVCLSCNIKKKNINTDDLFDKYGGVEFEVDNEKYITPYNTNKKYILKKESTNYSLMLPYIKISSNDFQNTNNRIDISLQKIERGIYVLSDTNTLVLIDNLLQFQTDANHTGILTIEENNGIYIIGKFECVINNTNNIKVIKYGRFKVFFN